MGFGNRFQSLKEIQTSCGRTVGHSSGLSLERKAHYFRAVRSLANSPKGSQSHSDIALFPLKLGCPLDYYDSLLFPIFLVILSRVSIRMLLD
jgi:hypothetical protein